MKHLTLGNGYVALVDDQDFEYLSPFNWLVDSRNGYAFRRVVDSDRTKKTSFMHREILGCPPGIFIKHLDGNKLNNQRSNLVLCTKAEITHTRKPRNDKIHSRYKGVSWDTRQGKCNGRWAARITFNGKIIRLGYFATEREAAMAYNQAAIEYFGPLCYLNDVGFVNMSGGKRGTAPTSARE